MTTTEILDGLQQAIVDLDWLSESEYPFEVMTWEQGIELTSTALFKGEDRCIDTNTLGDFLAPAIATEDWYDAEELEQVRRYQALLHAIESTLTQVQVFRLGEVDVDIYIVGKTPSGDIVGLKTRAIET